MKASKRTSMSLSITRSIDKLGRLPTPFETRVYKVDLLPNQLSCILCQDGAVLIRAGMQMCIAIPAGKVTTYGELAKALSSSSRAIGQVP